MRESVGYKLLSAVIYIFIGVWMFNIISSAKVDESGRVIVEDVSLFDGGGSSYRDDNEVSDNSNDDSDDEYNLSIPKEQLDTFISHVDDWYLEGEDISYAVTDYNFDGNLEICRSTLSGTFSTSVIFEYYHGQLKEYRFDDSLVREPSIMCSSLPCYHQTNVLAYYYTSMAEFGSGPNEDVAIEYVFSVGPSTTINCESIKSMVMVTDDSGEEILMERYRDETGDEIDFDTYNTVDDRYFADWEKQTCYFEFINAYELQNDMVSGLCQSWEGFYLE